LEICTRGNAGHKFLTIPYCPTNKEDKGYDYEIYTTEIKLICDYTGLNFKEINDMDFDEYKLLFRDAYIWKLQQSEKGQEFLKDCWALEKSEPDREKLRQAFIK
jgi:hypothetical protein